MIEVHATRLMKWTLTFLGFYFFLITLAHLTAFKIPLLFVYYNVPSNAYQDNIIAFMAFGWAVFFFTAARDPRSNLRLIGAILIAAFGAVCVLSYTNLSTDFASLDPQISVTPFWYQTALLAGLSIWLAVLLRAMRQTSDDAF